MYLLLVNTGSSGNATLVKNGMRPVSAGLNEHEANGSSQYCPRHHHHTTTQQQGPQQRQTPSPNKRHRLTPRPQNIQRPCLDFEKMQQVPLYTAKTVILGCWNFESNFCVYFADQKARGNLLATSGSWTFTFLLVIYKNWTGTGIFLERSKERNS